MTLTLALGRGDHQTLVLILHMNGAFRAQHILRRSKTFARRFTGRGRRPQALSRDNSTSSWHAREVNLTISVNVDVVSPQFFIKHSLDIFIESLQLVFQSKSASCEVKVILDL